MELFAGQVEGVSERGQRDGIEFKLGVTSPCFIACEFLL